MPRDNEFQARSFPETALCASLLARSRTGYGKVRANLARQALLQMGVSPSPPRR